MVMELMRRNTKGLAPMPLSEAIKLRKGDTVYVWWAKVQAKLDTLNAEEMSITEALDAIDEN